MVWPDKFFDLFVDPAICTLFMYNIPSTNSVLSLCLSIKDNGAVNHPRADRSLRFEISVWQRGRQHCRLVYSEGVVVVDGEGTQVM